jgi:hypothetical protein
VHHSSEELEWISAARFHPVNLFFGAVIADVFCCSPASRPTSSSCSGPSPSRIRRFVHANLDWTLGPFKYVIATPVFHRWHHTAADRGGEKELCRDLPGSRPLMFGTFYMPAGELPDRYGIDDREFPTTFGAQLMHPFKAKRRFRKPRLQLFG